VVLRTVLVIIYPHFATINATMTRATYIMKYSSNELMLSLLLNTPERNVSGIISTATVLHANESGFELFDLVQYVFEVGPDFVE
jgi:hypothetical protein